VPCFARYFPEGSYETDVVNLGALEPQRLEVDLGVTQPIDASLPIRALAGRSALGRRRLPDGSYLPLGTRFFSARNTIGMKPLFPVDVDVDIATSDSGAGPLSDYRPFVPGTYEFWRCQLRVTARGDGLRYVNVPRLIVERRKFNFKDEGHVVLGGGAPVDVVFAQPFTAAPEVVPAISGVTGAVSVKFAVTVLTASGFKIEAFDQTGASIGITARWIAAGV
jgi:hypothetical protein